MSEWIRTSDRLPDEGQAVFYYFSGVGVHSGHYRFYPEDGPVLGQVFHGPRGFLGGDVTHWMPRSEGQPLPDPPTAEPEA